MDNQKVILITGCSSGFGLLAAVRLARRGHFVWATMRDLSKKQPLEEELTKNNAQAFIRPLDVTKPETIAKVVDEILKRHGHIDVLINNAGHGVAGFFEDTAEEEMRNQMETNFFGVQNVCRQVIPLMRPRLKGRIINISSIAGRTATPCLGAYNASKWALEAFSESLYYELALFGISVTLIEPGSYPTKIFKENARYAKHFGDPQSPYFSYSQKLKDFVESTIRKLKRDPDHVAGMIEAVVHHPRPRLRYVSDFSSLCRIMGQRVLPPSFLSTIFRRFMHGNK